MIENLRTSKILFKVKILNPRSTLEILRFNNLKVIKKEILISRRYKKETTTIKVMASFSYATF